MRGGGRGPWGSPPPPLAEMPHIHKELQKCTTVTHSTYLSGTLLIAPTRWVFGGVVIVALFVPIEYPVGGGGGYVGYIRKALEKGYLEHPGSACCAADMFEIFVRFGQGLCSLLPLFVNRQLPCPYTNSLHGLLRPRMHHKSFSCAKGLALGVQSGCR